MTIPAYAVMSVMYLVSPFLSFMFLFAKSPLGRTCCPPHVSGSCAFLSLTSGLVSVGSYTYPGDLPHILSQNIFSCCVRVDLLFVLCWVRIVCCVFSCVGVLLLCCSGFPLLCIVFLFSSCCVWLFCS